MKKAVLSVLGNDRPGILAAVTRVLFNQNCNIENVSQTILQTEFSGTFIVSMPGQLSLQALAASLKATLDPLDLDVHVKGLGSQQAIFAPTHSEPFIITTKGPDRKGLVAGITEIIARHGVNVTNLQAVFKGGNQPGDNIMIYEVDVPSQLDQAAFSRNLRQKARELALDISIQHRNIFEAINRI